MEYAENKTRIFGTERFPQFLHLMKEDVNICRRPMEQNVGITWQNSPDITVQEN